jgi:hypothetical protein
MAHTKAGGIPHRAMINYIDSVFEDVIIIEERRLIPPTCEQLKGVKTVKGKIDAIKSLKKQHNGLKIFLCNDLDCGVCKEFR